MNFAISGLQRVVREVKTGLLRRQPEERLARQSAEQMLLSELRETVTAMLLSCDLAMRVPGVPPAAYEKIRTMQELTTSLRARLSGTR